MCGRDSITVDSVLWFVDIHIDISFVKDLTAAFQFGF